jgi:hypothetical protein
MLNLVVRRETARLLKVKADNIFKQVTNKISLYIVGIKRCQNARPTGDLTREAAQFAVQ